MDKLQFDGDRGLSHAYIVAAQSERVREHTILPLASAAVCSSTGKKPCGVCRDCRKAKDGVHPDIIHVRRETDEKGRAKREIRVDQIREMITQAQIMPNEASGKAFIIHDAETMNPNAQNALLKLLEEPPKGVMLILSTGTPAMLLPTIRSRCIEMVVNDDSPALDREMEQAALEYLKRVSGRKRSELLAWCNEKAAVSDIASATLFVDTVQVVLVDLLAGRRPGCGLTMPDCWRLVQLMETCRTYLAVNVGIKHIFGVIAVKSIGEEVPVEMRKS